MSSYYIFNIELIYLIQCQWDYINLSYLKGCSFNLKEKKKERLKEKRVGYKAAEEQKGIYGNLFKEQMGKKKL